MGRDRRPCRSALSAPHPSPRSASSGVASRVASPLPLFGVEPPKPQIEAVRIVDMNSSNAWAEFAHLMCELGRAHLEHEQAKAELKSLVRQDAQQAIGHGLRAKRSKSGAINLELLNVEGGRAARPVNQLARWQAPSPKPKSNSLIREKSLVATIRRGRHARARTDFPLRTSV